jgi:hypothetical protein
VKRLVRFLVGAALVAAPLSAAVPLIAPAPYEAPRPDTPHRIAVRVDLAAARAILTALAGSDPAAGRALSELPALREQIGEAGKGPARFAEDFAAALSPEAAPATFDLRSARQDRERILRALDLLDRQRSEIEKTTAARVAALVPADVPVSLEIEIDVTVALAGLADHVVSSPRDGRSRVLIDGSRLFGALSEGELIEGFGRIAAEGAFRGAWEIYRRTASGWRKDPDLGGADALAAVVVTMGPVWLYTFDRNFFPLARWLKEPMIASVDAFNRECDELLDPGLDLGRRAEILAALRRGGLGGDPALAAGAFFADGIFQALGAPALLSALAGGPHGLLQAYERACQKQKGLPPLSRRLQEKLQARR